MIEQGRAIQNEADPRKAIDLLSVWDNAVGDWLSINRSGTGLAERWIITISEEMSVNIRLNFLQNVSLAQSYLMPLLLKPRFAFLESVERTGRMPPRIFISHGPESAALIHLKLFLHEMGTAPVLAEEEPSLNAGLDLKIEKVMESCVAAVILATGDDTLLGKKTSQPRQNVIHEIGVAQIIYPKRVIYLLEANCELPSNISPKIYTRFTRDNLTEAFIVLQREIRAANLL